MQTLRSTVATLAVVTVLLTAGCLGPLGLDDTESADEPASDELSADELLERSQSAHTELDSVQATMTMEMDTETMNQTVTYDLWLGPDESIRMEFVKGDGAATQPTVMVVNGSTTWIYDEGQNRAMKMDLGLDPEEMAAMAENLSGSVDDMDAERVGTDTIAGRETTILDVSGDDSAPFAPENMTLWIDEETYYPLKQVVTMSEPAETSMTMTMESFEPDASVSSDLFSFEPPADAEVVDFGEGSMTTHENVSAADAAAPFDVPKPSVPEGYAFQSATTMEGLNGVTASLQYAAEGEDRLTVSVAESPTGAASGVGGESITIGDVEATLTSTEVMNISSTSIRWTSDGLTYSVSGTADEETLRSVAESIVE
ncbi:DUF2092 domain-containing protein [Halovivax limisalsi]|uniref:DUF2092 domain-containing protein n=1 Tax=Halovivax limisalsi TaxID=1453760 RepID=UPI001FFCDDBD|nr:DUF2092 domain-containing protein [Halovivax limisalsi]